MSARLGRAVAVIGLGLALGGCSETVTLEGADLPQLGAVAGEVEQARLMALVGQLVDERGQDTPMDWSRWERRMNPLSPFFFLTRDRSRAWMEAELTALGYEVRYQDGSGDAFDTRNLIADLRGADRPDEVVIVGAHFDAFWSGADDNATGVAAVLELARVLEGHRFSRTIRFVGFDLEEAGDVGSVRYAAERDPDETITAAVVFDSIGYADSSPGSQQSLPGLPSPSVGDFLLAIGNEDSSRILSELYALNRELGITQVTPLVTVGDGRSPTGEPLLRSDHLAFWFEGQPAIFLTDTALYRNPNYHTETDTVDTLNPAFFTGVVRISAAAVSYWAGGVP